MSERSHTREVVLPIPPEAAFALLHTPSAIRGWWGAASALVLPEPGGIWAATWGPEDAPDYVMASTLEVFDPPRRMVLAAIRYAARQEGPLPFDGTRLRTDFTVESHPEGALLRVVQSGFPAEACADAFYSACEAGWRATFESLQRHAAATAASGGC